MTIVTTVFALVKSVLRVAAPVAAKASLPATTNTCVVAVATAEINKNRPISFFIYLLTPYWGGVKFEIYCHNDGPIDG